jgi:putative ABC transport system permease protein
VYIVLGVLPQEFRGLDRGPVTDVWIDLDTWTRYYGRPSALLARGQRAFEVVARLRAGARVAEADAQLAALAQQWHREYPDQYRRRTLAAATADEISGASGWRLALLLVAIVALVVFIAAINVATLRLAQGDARRRELGVRLALGAAPPRLARQLLGEGLLVVATAAAAGILVGAWLIRATPAFLPPAPVAVDYGIALDRRVLAVTLTMAAVAAALSRLVPALRASRTDVIRALKAVEGGSRVRLLSLRTLLVTSQVALAVVLVNGAGLLLQGFLATRSTWPGFATHKDLLVLTLTAPDAPDALTGWELALAAMRDRVTRLPGVARATYVRRIPMAGHGGGATLPVSLPSDRGAAASRALRYNQVGPDYLETLGTHLLRGRFFADSEHNPTARVVVVNETLSRQFFEASHPIGEYLTIGREQFEIIGIVEDTRISRLHEDGEPFFYLPFAVRPSEDVALVLETNVPAATLARAARQTVRAVNPEARVLMTTTMHDHMAEQVYDERMPAVLGTALAAMGVGLALVGLYGAVALLTVRRTRELGIRLALGAAPKRIVGLVLAQGIVIAAAGAIVGVGLALATSTLLASILRSRGSHDTAILLASAGAALLIGTLAAMIPAARTLRIDPSRTLRYE